MAPPTGVDAPALNALLIAALQQLALSAAATGAFAGLNLSTDADWTRVRETATAVIRGAYGE